MKNIISIVGSQWGDEGKGKVTDLLAQDADIIVRYQGGNNAGHTIEFDNKKYSLHLLPSGVFNKGNSVVIANGVVVNPRVLVNEIDMINKEGFNDAKIYISNRSHIILPYHEIEDILQEELKGDDLVGTTKKGIGPCYADKINRIGIRMEEFINEKVFKDKLKKNVESKNKYFKQNNQEEINFEEIYEEYSKLAKVIKPFVCDTSIFLHDAIKKNKKVIFEGAQGVMLDIEHGTYPFVTSSSPSCSSIPINVGIPAKFINNTIAITKAYTSRVGEGPFPTELFDEVGEHIRNIGREYGTTTQRARSVGWLDIVQLKHSIRINGYSQMAIMLLDVLSDIKSLKICIGYKLDGKEIDYIPAIESEYSRVEPIYITCDGFNGDISKVKNYEELPINARKYLEKIESLLEVPITLISVGPDRTQSIIKKDLWSIND